MNESMNLAAVVVPSPTTSGDYQQANVLEFKKLWWEVKEDVGFLAHRIIHFLLFLGRTLGLGFHTVLYRMAWETASLGFFIYQTKQTQTFDLMARIPKWMISLSPFNNGMRPLVSSSFLLGGGGGQGGEGCGRSGGLEWRDNKY